MSNIDSTSWKIIDKYFNENKNCLVEHHLDSFNRFYSNDIFQIFNELNPIKIRKNYDDKLDIYDFECNIYMGGKNGHNVYFGKPIIYDNDFTHFMFPNEARLRNMTYGTSIHYELFFEFKVKNKAGEFETDTLTKENVFLGRFPIMVQSNLCALANLPPLQRYELGECKNDYGGYFIIDGKEKAIVPQEKFADNLLYVKENDSNSLYLYSAIIRNVSEDASKPVRTMKMHIVAPTDKYTNANIVVEVPNVRKPIPLFILMRALGCTSDKDIIQTCLLDLEKHEEFVDLFIPSVYDAGGIFTQENAIKYISTFLKHKTIHHTYEILMNYLLPQIGELNFKNKAIFLGHMCFSLLKVYKKIEKPTDRDSFAFKRVELPGSLIYDLFKEYFILQQKQIFLTIDKDINYHYKNKINLGTEAIIEIFTSNLQKYFGARILEKGFKRAFKGSWGATPHTKRVGVLQDLNRLSYYSFISHLRKINLPLDESAKVVGPRLLHSSQWGIIDPVDTPDGANCGLHKHMTLMSKVSNGYSKDKLLKWLNNHLELILLEESSPIELFNLSKVFINGTWVGSFDNLIEKVNISRQCRRLGLIPFSTSISFSIKDNSIFYSTDSGRLFRPLYYLDNYSPSFKTTHNFDKLSWKQLYTGVQDKINVDDDNFFKHDFVYSTDNDFIDTYKKNKSIIEYIDTLESESLLISTNVSQLSSNHGYSHLEIHPSLLFGVMGNLVIFPEHNQLPRNLFSCGQSKQATSLYHTNYNNRVDKSGIVLNYGQCPLVKSKYLKYFNNEENPYGVNTIVAIMSHGGYNVEDAILVNKGAIDRGLFRTTYFNTYESYEESSQVAGNEVDSVFSNNKVDVENTKFDYKYDFLDENGLIREETPVDDKTIIIGKKSTDNESNKYYDTSMGPKKGQIGIVDKAFITAGEEGFRIAKVRIRENRIPAIGDKMASRAGQKGTIGLVIEEENMPFTEHGLKPDLIINPHAIPSRMTIGQLVECIMGKVCANIGTFGDCTAYNTGSNNMELYQNALKNMNFESNGNDILYNGMTGEQIQSEIFIGPTYYMRLKHMVKDKINYRARGPIMSLTKQPVKGRANDGGLRIGEMERDAVIAHGAASFLKESLLDRGDKYSIAICNSTGTIAAYNQEQNIFFSPFVDGPTHYISNINDVHKQRLHNISKFGRSFSIVQIPYTFKLLIQELQTMNIQTRIITEDNVNQMMSLSGSDNYKKLAFDNEINLLAHINNSFNSFSSFNQKRNTDIENLRNLDKDEENKPDTPYSPPYAPGSPGFNPYTPPSPGDLTSPAWDPSTPNNLNVPKIPEKQNSVDEAIEISKMQFNTKNAEDTFTSYYKKKFPESTDEQISYAYDSFLRDGIIIKPNSAIEPTEFTDKDEQNVKKTEIDYSKDDIDTSDIFEEKKKKSSSDDLDINLDDDDDDNDNNDNDQSGGKFTLKKTINL